MKKILLATLFISGVAMAGEPSPVAKQEVAHLLSHLEKSGCQFNRNGSWYSSGEAVAHLHKKYDYLLKKDLASSAEDFIARAASESSISGKPYQVKCGSGAPEQSGLWLKAELARYRAGNINAASKPPKAGALPAQ